MAQLVKATLFPRLTTTGLSSFQPYLIGGWTTETLYHLGFVMSCICFYQVLLRPDMVRARVGTSQMGSTVVETQFGKLRGVVVNLSSKNLPQVEAYLGLQYASVLKGELRFMPPTGSLEKWDGIRVALKFRPVCPQRIPSEEELRKSLPLERVEHLKRILPFIEKQDEECLNLNIYVPVRGKCR